MYRCVLLKDLRNNFIFRRTIENAFGILASRWRVFRKPILTSPERATHIVKATLCLHNYLQGKNIGLPPSKQKYCSPLDIDYEDNYGNIRRGNWRDATALDRNLLPIAFQGSHNYKRQAAQVRSAMTQYFNTQDKLPWQDCYVNRGCH